MMKYKVLRITPENNKHIGLISVWQDDPDLQVDFWRAPSVPDRYIDIMLSSKSANKIERALENFNIPYDILIPDVQKVIDDQLISNQGNDTDFDYSKYHTFEEIQAWVSRNAKLHNDIASVVEITTTYEGRIIHALKIGKPSSTTRDKPAIWIEGGIHAREWISPATVIYIMKEFLGRYGRDKYVTDLVNTYDWYFLPVFNADGYAYTWSSNRMWRKTRTRRQNSTCIGVDPNRNWDAHWGEAGASHSPCSDSYCGPYPFSEPSVKGVSDFIKRNGRFIAFMDFHSYSQLWMSPWGYTTDLPKDFEIQDALSASAVRALGSVHSTKYQHGTIANVIYVASGSSVDWTYDKVGILYSYGIELRDTGRFGFLLPPAEIIPSGEETFDAVVASGMFIMNNPPSVV
ncbi:carboxypeptidase B-like isoform X2 [Glandiceps talaboti]